MKLLVGGEMIIDTINYVTSGDGFWWAMGWTAACGSMVGGMIHNGDLKGVKKALVSVGVYVSFLVYTSWLRLVGTREIPLFERHPNSTAGIITNIFVAIFYGFGMFLGVLTLWIFKHRVKIKKKLQSLWM